MLSKYEIHRINIINKIYEKEKLSRNDLHELLDLRFATITKIVKELIEDGIIEETGEKRKKGKGRPHSLLKIIPDCRFFIGCELNPENVIGVILNFKGKLIKKDKIEICKTDKKEDILKKIEKLLKNIIEKREIEKNKIYGIGFVDPGIIDVENGISIFSSILPQWRNVETKKYIEEKFNIKTFIIGSSQAKVLSEKFFGEGKEIKNFIFVEFGDGIGCGIMSEGKILHGTGGVAGEFGHIKIKGIEEICNCGKKGCIEAVASIPSIEKKVEIATGKKLKIKDIVDEYKKDNHEIKKILDNVLDIFSLSISNLINILNPEIVILDKNFLLFEKFLDGFIEKIKSNMVYDYPVKFKISNFDDDIGAIGGACLSISKFLGLDI
jgi:N-acetylglucosamine repressor